MRRRRTEGRAPWPKTSTDAPHDPVYDQPPRDGGVRRAATSLPRLRLPGDRGLPALVPALRRHVELGHRLHEHPARSATSTSRWSSGCCSSSTTFLLAWLYARYSNAKLDPLARELDERYNAVRDERPRRAADMSTPDPHHDPLPRRRRADHRHHLLGQPADLRRRRLLRRRPRLLRLPERPGHRRRLHVGRVVPRHLRRHRADRLRRLPLLRSASSSPGWWRCCWSPRCCATPAATRWPTSWPTGCGSARSAPRPPPRPSSSRSSTCWPRWSAPARSSRCCSASTARPRSTSRSSPSASLMIFYVTVGGMKGTTWVQIVKAVLLMAGSALIVVLVLARVQLQPLRPARRRGQQHRQGPGVPRARPEVRRRPPRARSTSSASASPWCSAPPACRTS